MWVKLSTKVGLAEDGLVQVGRSEIRPAEVGPTEYGLAEVGVAEVGPDEFGLAEVGPDEVGPAEVGPTKWTVSQITSWSLWTFGRRRWTPQKTPARKGCRHARTEACSLYLP
jgi:hypothetical protein